MVTTMSMKREALTIRFPTDLLAKARKLKDSDESFNDLIVEALDREVKRRRGWAAHQRIIARSEIIKAKTGMQPSSIDMIRNLRKGEGRCD